MPPIVDIRHCHREDAWRHDAEQKPPRDHLIERGRGGREHCRGGQRERRAHDDAAFAPVVGEPADEGRRQRNGCRRRCHRQADLEVAGAEHVLKQRQQRLGGVQAEKGREAGQHDGNERLSQQVAEYSFGSSCPPFPLP